MFHTNICLYLLQVCVNFIGLLGISHVSIMGGGYDMIEFIGGCAVIFNFFMMRCVFFGVRCWSLRMLLSLCICLPRVCLINKRQPETQTFSIQSPGF